MLKPQKYHLDELSNALSRSIPEKLRESLELRLTEFKNRRDELAGMVSEGELTLKFANSRTRELAAELNAEIKQAILKHDQNRPVLADSLQKSKSMKLKPPGADEIQRQSLEMLRANLVELQIANRKSEFESRSFVRNATNQMPTPSVDKLFEMIQDGLKNRDSAAVEWSRRQLEQLRPVVTSENLQQRIDIACDRPDTVNPRILENYRQSISAYLDQPQVILTLLDRAVELKDANACIAVYETVRVHAGRFSDEIQSQIAGRIELFSETVLNYTDAFEKEQSQIESRKIDAFKESYQLYLEHAADLGPIQPLTEKELEMKRQREAIQKRDMTMPMGLILGQVPVTQPSTNDAEKPADSEPDIGSLNHP